jgi:cytochrome c peroxidase
MHKTPHDSRAWSGSTSGKIIVTGLVAAGVCLLSLPASAQTSTPSAEPAATAQPDPSSYTATPTVDDSDCPGYSVCPVIDFQHAIATNRGIKQLNANITLTEQQTLQQILSEQYLSDPSAPQNAKTILGKVMIYDRNLSVNGLVACATCHTAEAGFKGGSSLFNATTAAFVGAIGDRARQRSPMSMAYAAFAPMLYYRASTGDMVGGDNWDQHSTGLVTGIPAGDQALGPPLNPLEMANPDAACVVYHLSQSQYRPLFEAVWGSNSFNITWPASTPTLCAQPGGASTTANSAVVPLSTSDRNQATMTFHNMGLSMAAYEATPEVSPFSSKFDYVQRGQAQFTPVEERGYQLYNGQAGCNQCHVSSGDKPLFTDFTTVNLGIPKNPDVPYYTENEPDSYDYVGNPLGENYKDEGTGAFLTSSTNPNPALAQYAANFLGAFQVATLRNVAKRPHNSFVKAYMHNGYFKTLEDIVHFYNTRDALPTCPSDIGTEVGGPVGKTCWPAPEVTANENHTQLGNLGLSPEDELAVVAFLGTLSDGYSPPQQEPAANGQ